MNKITTQDNFCGTKSMTKVAKERGYECQSLDNDPQHNADITGDILEINPGPCGYAHFSPSCTAFSVASIGHHWGGGSKAYIPKTETAKLGLRLLNRVAELIAKNEYPYYTIENPRCIFRKLMPDILRKHGVTDFRIVTVSYCQYGDTRMKPTDFITNIPEWKGKLCKNGAPCHVAAPRGSRTGTQGLKNAKLRGVIPPALFHEIFDYIEKDQQSSDKDE